MQKMACWNFHGVLSFKFGCSLGRVPQNESKTTMRHRAQGIIMEQKCSLENAQEEKEGAGAAKANADCCTVCGCHGKIHFSRGQIIHQLNHNFIMYSQCNFMYTFTFIFILRHHSFSWSTSTAIYPSIHPSNAFIRPSTHSLCINVYA